MLFTYVQASYIIGVGEKWLMKSLFILVKLEGEPNKWQTLTCITVALHSK